jgi:Holliday junction DNA helicase RuvA
MSGIGPRAAVTVLSGIDAREFARAVCSGDLARLCLIPGVGKKKAGRMVLDLKEKLVPLAQPQKGEQAGASANLEDLRSALTNLGFRGSDVEKAVVALREKVAQGVDLDVLLPEALKLVRG